MSKFSEIEAESYLKELVEKITKGNANEPLESKPILCYIKDKIELPCPISCCDFEVWAHKEEYELGFYSDQGLDQFFLLHGDDYERDEFHKVGIREVEITHDLAFLTREAAQRHIDANRHHYRKPYTWARGVWRDPEMSKLFEALHVLYGENKEDAEDVEV